MDLSDKNLSPKKLPDRKKRLAKGCTTLMYSCQQGKSDDIVTELRIKPKSVHRRDKTNKSALHYCCGQLDLVAAASITTAAPELLESADEDGLTPLHLAVIQGNMALVNLLLANKANVNAVDNEGHSVVHWAAVCGEVDALRALLAAGADITKTDLNGGSPLHYAAQMSNGSGYQVHSANLALDILEIFLQQPNVQVDVCDKDGRQPLLWAASAGAVKAVLLLVKAGARIESADKDGLTALHCAASRGHTECINVLINLCGAPIDLIDSNGCTALHYAVTLGHADATAMLLDLSSDPNRQDRKGRTPAHCGCAKGQFETVKMLRDRKANMWLRNAKGDLPLHEAAASGRRELVLWLLDQRPKHVNTTSNDGRTILHIAAGNDYTDMCKMLIDFGADINSIYRLPGNVVQTPLDCALSKGHRSTAKFLQLHGGLPANKLRLSGRNPNALNDQELVKPLTFSGDKSQYAAYMENELPKKSRSVWLYVNQSDSDAESKDDQTVEETSANSLQTKRRSRKSCGCHYHYHHHYRHRCRFRSNSCERIEILERDSGPDSAICRSKSNVEICLYHKRRPKHRHDTSKSTSSVGTCSEEENSSNDYSQRNARRKKDSHRVKDKAAENTKANDKKPISSTKSNGSKRDRATRKKESEKAKVGQRNEPSPKIETMNDVKNNESNANNVMDAEAKHIEQAETKMDVVADKPTEIIPDVSQSNDTTAADETRKQSIVTVADVHTPSESILEQSTAENAIEPAIETESANQTEQNEKPQSKPTYEIKLVDADEPKSDNTNKKKDEITQNGGDVDVVSDTVEANKMENVENPIEQAPNTDETVAQTTTEPIIVKPNTTETNESAIDGSKQTEQLQDIANDVNAEQKLDGNAPITPIEPAEATEPNDEFVDDTKPIANDTPKHSIDSSKSFHVLPNNENKSSDNQNQDNDTGNLDPPTEVIRKTSFTVLNSDESIDDLLLGMANEQEKDEQPPRAGDHSNRPKSFRVLNAHDANGEDIILQQSSDQEMGGGIDNDDEYLTRDFTGRSGKYSDSELIKFEGQLNGRRKKYKKRAKSVKQLTIVDASQQNKDHDSGFEPSPRALRSQKASTIRSIYTANLSERPRAGDIVDGRAALSTRHDRKPGDKSAVNMSTVSQTLQRNIRRYYMEHKIFQHLLELKSLQIRSTKVNESLLVKRAVDDYHKSTMELGLETGGTLKRYPYKEYTFKNFEIFLYEVLKSLQKNGSNNFQNISDVYLEAERRLSPEYSRCKKAMFCTSKTHRCLHAAHAYTGIPCAAYIPMMNHHTMPKYGFGKTSMGSFYLPKICTKGGGIGGAGKCGSGNNAHNTVSLELSHGNNRQLITLPAEKLDNNKRYYVTFTLKENEQAQTTSTEPKK